MIIGLCGPSGSGKTSLAKLLVDEIGGQIISLDNYFLLDPPYKKYGDNEKDWELPENTDWEAIRSLVTSLKQGLTGVGKLIDWDSTVSKEIEYRPSEIVVIEGFLLFHDTKLLEMMDLRAYIHVPDEVGISRRLKRAGAAGDRTWFETITFPEYAPRRELFKKRAHIVLDGTLPLIENVHKLKESLAKVELD